MYIAKMTEDGRKLMTSPFTMIDEARAEGKRKWQTTSFDIIEVDDECVESGYYRAIQYVPVSRRAA